MVTLPFKDAPFNTEFAANILLSIAVTFNGELATTKFDVIAVVGVIKYVPLPFVDPVT